MDKEVESTKQPRKRPVELADQTNKHSEERGQNGIGTCCKSEADKREEGKGREEVRKEEREESQKRFRSTL